MKNRNLNLSRSSTRIIAIILTIVTGIVLFWGLTILFRPVPVVELKNKVPTGQMLKISDLSITSVSKRDRHLEAYINTGDVVGQYAATDLFPGQQLIKGQITSNPDKLRNALAGIQISQTVLQLTSAQAFWPDILRNGDYVMIQAVYPDLNQTMDLGVGRIAKDQDMPVGKNLAQLSQAQSATASQTQQTVVTSIDTEKKALIALYKSKMIYLMPIHPKLGREAM